MGNCCLRRKKRKKIVLLLLGLDNAGKTVAVKNLAGEPFKEVVPTVGFSVIKLQYMNFKVNIFDLGGGSNIRGIWSRYFVDAHGIIFVVDSGDYFRLSEVKDVLQNLLSHDKIRGKPILLLANKQDSENALDELDLIESLQLEDLVNKAHCPTLVEPSCAKSIVNKSKLDPGIKKGYNWLVNYIIREYEIIDKRVQSDVEEQEKIDARARQKIRDRLHNSEQINRQDEIEDFSKTLNNGNHNHMFHSTDSIATYLSDSLLDLNYFGTTENLIEKNRPKSATQMVKNQLKHNKRSLFTKKSSNKIEPVNILGTKSSHSAFETRTTVLSDRRTLRSAGDSVFVMSDNAITHTSSYNAGDGDLQRQLLGMPRTQGNLKLSSLKNVDAVIEYNDNSISVIEVD